MDLFQRNSENKGQAEPIILPQSKEVDSIYSLSRDIFIAEMPRLITKELGENMSSFKTKTIALITSSLIVAVAGLSFASPAFAQLKKQKGPEKKTEQKAPEKKAPPAKNAPTKKN